MIKSLFLRTIQNLSTNIPLRVITITYPVADTGEAKPLDRHVVINFPLQNLS
jgi:hypothetical protein